MIGLILASSPSCPLDHPVDDARAPAGADIDDRRVNLTYSRKRVIVETLMTSESRARLSIDVPREARRRIRLAAARRDQSIREYVWQAVEARLEQDLAEEGPADASALHATDDPVLAELWDNPDDAAYDRV
jgi:uncharacterized protein (DUF1778 family)